VDVHPVVPPPELSFGLLPNTRPKVAKALPCSRGSTYTGFPRSRSARGTGVARVFAFVRIAEKTPVMGQTGNARG
jgi:hypothetical protein